MSFVFSLLVTLLFSELGFDPYSVIAIGVFSWYLRFFVVNLDKRLALRELVLLLYALNFLLAPALIYNIEAENFYYGLKIPPEQFFALSIPSMLLLHFGLFLRKSSIFYVDLNSIRLESTLNGKLVLRWMAVGIGLSLVFRYLPGELSFICYLVAMLRYIAAFALYILDRKKYRLPLLILFGVELTNALRFGMFGDLVVWVAFGFMVWCYIAKPSLIKRCLLLSGSLLVILVLQLSKADYRARTWYGQEETGYSSFISAVESATSVYSSSNGKTEAVNVLTRVNQGWILASTVDNMNRMENYQGLTLVGKYLEAALLPRVLAPDKLRSEDKSIFNEFSGHTISNGISMGLGVLADGYIAYGAMGVYLFAFVFGLMFYLVFKVMERWTAISPFFAVFMFPVFFYAIRPDCDTQTLLGVMIKSLMLYTALVYFYKRQFAHRMQFIPATPAA